MYCCLVPHDSMCSNNDHQTPTSSHSQERHSFLHQISTSCSSQLFILSTLTTCLSFPILLFCILPSAPNTASHPGVMSSPYAMAATTAGAMVAWYSLLLASSAETSSSSSVDGKGFIKSFGAASLLRSNGVVQSVFLFFWIGVSYLLVSHSDVEGNVLEVTTRKIVLVQSVWMAVEVVVIWVTRNQYLIKCQVEGVKVCTLFRDSEWEAHGYFRTDFG